MADEATVRKVVERFFEFTGADVARAEELYHDDAVLEFPQSGERFEGRATFTEWRSQYPVSRGRPALPDPPDRRPRGLRRDRADRQLRPRRELGLRGQLLDFRDDKVIRAHLRRRGLGGPGVARQVALGDARRPAGLTLEMQVVAGRGTSGTRNLCGRLSIWPNRPST